VGMDLLNQVLDSFSAQLAEITGFEQGIHIFFKLDLFESNIINLFILWFGLVSQLGGALSESLSTRQQNILKTIQNAEEKLQEATTRLAEGEAKLEQAQIVVESIQSDAKQVAAQVKSTILSDGKEEIVRLIAVDRAQLRTIEKRLRKELSNSIAELTLERIRVQFENKLTSSLQQQIIDRNIFKLAEEVELWVLPLV